MKDRIHKLCVWGVNIEHFKKSPPCWRSWSQLEVPPVTWCSLRCVKEDTFAYVVVKEILSQEWNLQPRGRVRQKYSPTACVASSLASEHQSKSKILDGASGGGAEHRWSGSLGNQQNCSDAGWNLHVNYLIQSGRKLKSEVKLKLFCKDSHTESGTGPTLQLQ